MRYRRLGETELMVSEVGLDLRALESLEMELAEEVVRAAILAGITVLVWDVSDEAMDLERLIARAVGVDRGRLTTVAILDHVPAPEAVGPQIEAIASRLAVNGVEGWLDVIAFPGDLDAPREVAVSQARTHGAVRFDGRAAGSQVQVGGAVMTFVPDIADAVAALAAGEYVCAIVPVTSVEDVRELTAADAWV